MSSSKRPVILTFVGNYLPGYKVGGLLRTIVNTVDHLCGEYEFRIMTRDRDLGDDRPYAEITPNAWQPVGNASVYYFPPEATTMKDVLGLITSTPHDVLYLNSFFDAFTVKALMNRRLGRAAFKQVIVAPRGEFAWASLKQKYPKKYLFIKMARLIGLYKGITWHASSEYEAQDIMKYMNTRSEEIHVAFDFPIKCDDAESAHEATEDRASGSDELRLVFLSRISREKNLDYALRVLKKVKSRVVYDIYGPAEDVNYWNECQELIRALPSNVKVNYLGGVRPDQVVKTFGQYDLFLFPTGGEAYGHVIAESLTTGTMVLTSTETPWRGLQSDGLGWDIDLAHEDSFAEVIDTLASRSHEERRRMRNVARTQVAKRLLNPEVVEANRQLFRRSW